MLGRDVVARTRDEREPALGGLAESAAKGDDRARMAAISARAPETRRAGPTIIDQAEEARDADVRGRVPQLDLDAGLSIELQQRDNARIADALGIDAARRLVRGRRLEPKREGVSLDELAKRVQLRLCPRIARREPVAGRAEHTIMLRRLPRKIEPHELLGHQHLSAARHVPATDPGNDGALSKRAPQGAPRQDELARRQGLARC